MALLNEATDEKKFDIRMIERNLTRGFVAQDDVEKAAKKLPDDADNAIWVNPEELVAEVER